MKKNKMSLVLAFLCVGSVAAAESPADEAISPFDPRLVQHEGVHYFLTHNRVNVTVQKTTSTPRKVVVQDLPDSEPILAVVKSETSKHVSSLETDVSIEWIADTSQVFTLNLTPRASSDTDLKVTQHDDGRLAAINGVNTGQGGAILTNVFKFAATALGLTSPVGLMGPQLDDRAPTPQMQENCRASAFSQPLVAYDLLTRYAVQQSSLACNAWRATDRLTGDAKKLRDSVSELRRAMSSQTLDQAKNTTARIDLLDAQREAILTDRESQILIIEREKERLKSAQKIGANKGPTQNLKFSFMVPELPATGDGSAWANKTSQEVSAALDTFPKAKRLFDTTSIVVTVSAPPRSYAATTITLGDRDRCEIKLTHGSTKPSKNTPEYDRCDDQLIFYRRPLPATLTRWVLEKSSDGERLSLVEERSISVIRPESPLELIEFQARRWAKGQVEVRFGKSGVPTVVEWKSGSSANAITTALATSLAAARDEYETTIKKVVSIEDQVKKLKPEEVNELQKELDELMKQKELLNARMELEGAEASYETRLEQGRLNDQVLLLTAQQGVVAAEQAAVNQLELLRLEAQVTRLGKELAILKAQSQIDALSN